MSEMSVGDITRLNRMYNCPDYEAAKTSNDTLADESPTQFSNGSFEGLDIMKDNTTDDLMDAGSRVQNDDDFDDDMILTKEQIDELYSLNAAKRNGLKSAFHHWPQGAVAVEIDPTFRKAFTAFSSIFCAKQFLLAFPLFFVCRRTVKNHKSEQERKGKSKKLNLFHRPRIHFDNLRVHGLHTKSLVYTIRTKDGVR